MEQVLDYTKTLINIDKSALKFTNKNNDGYHDLSFMSPELFHFLTTGDIISSCNLSVIEQLDRLIDRFPSQQKNLENLNILLKTAFSMFVKESSDNLNYFILDPNYDLDLYELYDKIIGIGINSYELNSVFSDDVTKFIKKILAFKNPNIIIENKYNFNIDDMLEFNRLFTILEQKYFRGVINYQVPIFDLQNILIFVDYRTNSIFDLTLKIDERPILKRIYSDEIITELVKKYNNNIFLSGTQLLSLLNGNTNYNITDSLDIVHTGSFEERNKIINDIKKLGKNYTVSREIVVKFYINNNKQFLPNDLIRFFCNEYDLDYNVDVIIQKTNKKIEHFNAEQTLEYFVLCDKTKLEFYEPFRRIFKIYSYSKIEDYYRNENSIRISVKNFKILGYPSAMNILAKKNLFNVQSFDEEKKDFTELPYNTSLPLEKSCKSLNKKQNSIIFIYLSLVLTCFILYDVIYVNILY